MIARFCAYSVLKNLRFADPFLLLYLRDLGLSFTEAGTLLGLQHLIASLLEVPLGVVADRFGRRRSLAACFISYVFAFSFYGLAGERAGADLAVLLTIAASFFGLGEALRTGSHKAIILDWLDQRGEGDKATRVIGLARSFSKYSAGSSALVGGLLLFAFHDFRPLLWASAASSLLAFGLMLSYPRSLEGEQSRDKKSRRPWWRSADLRSMFRKPGIAYLLVQSLLFEAASKLLLKYYVQAYLASGLKELGVPVVARGASNTTGPVWMGIHEATRESIGGVAARLGHRMEAALGGALRALNVSYLIALFGCLGIAWCGQQLEHWYFLGLGLFIALTALQNARKPIFVAAFNRVMDSRQRATTLSLQNQLSSLAFALAMPVVGNIADRAGLAAVFWTVVAVLVIGWGLLRVLPAPEQA